jgi:hypothetical protein
MSLPLEVKRELLSLADQLEMAERSGDETRILAVEYAVNKRLDEIEALYPPTTGAGNGASFQTRLGALRNGLW